MLSYGCSQVKIDRRANLASGLQAHKEVPCRGQGCRSLPSVGQQEPLGGPSAIEGGWEHILLWGRATLHP